MPEIREPFVEGINRQFRLAAQFLSVVTFFLITGCSMVDLGFSPKSTLWELKEKAVTIYLLGSMHLLPENAYPLPVEMERAFQNSNRIVFEVDLGMASPDRISKAYQSVAAYPPNDDLSHHVSAETLSELRLVLNYLGLSFEAASGVWRRVRCGPPFLPGSSPSKKNRDRPGNVAGPNQCVQFRRPAKREPLASRHGKSAHLPNSSESDGGRLESRRCRWPGPAAQRRSDVRAGPRRENVRQPK